MSTKLIQAKHKTWIPEDDLKPVWGIDVCRDTLLTWATSKKGCRYLDGDQLRYRVKPVPMSGNGSGRFRTIEWWGKHIREISKKMEEERRELRARHTDVEFYNNIQELPPRYKCGGTGKPIFTPDLKQYGFSIKRDGSVVSAQYWRDNSCPHLNGRRFDAAFLYVEVGEGWRRNPWRWVWSEPDAKQIASALKLKAQTVQHLINSGKLIGDEALIPRECRANQNPDGAPWFTGRVVEYLKIAERFGKDDPTELLFNWQLRCRYMPNKQGLRSLQMSNGRLVWYDEEIQFLHKRFSSMPPRGRTYDENNLPAERREYGSINGAPLRVRVIEKLTGRKFSFSWLHRCPFKAQRQGLDYVYLKPAGEMVFLWTEVRSIQRGEVQPPPDTKPIPQHEVPSEYRDDDGNPLSPAPLDRAYKQGKPYGLPITQRSRLSDWREECEHCPLGYLRGILFHDALRDRDIWAHHREDCAAIARTLPQPAIPAEKLPPDHRNDEGRPLDHAALADAAHRGQPFGLNVSKGMLSEWRVKCEHSPTGKFDAISYYEHGNKKRFRKFAHNKETAEAIAKALNGDKNLATQSKDRRPEVALNSATSSGRGRHRSETSKEIKRLCFTHRLQEVKQIITVREIAKLYQKNFSTSNVMRWSPETGPRAKRA